METIGQLVQKAIDLAERELFEPAFVAACEALDQTAQKEFPEENLPEPAFQIFIKKYWTLINFIGLRHNVALPTELPFRLRRAVPSYTNFNKTGEMVIFVVRQTLATHHLPPEVAIGKTYSTEVQDEKLVFPRGLIFGILTSVVLHPANKNEEIRDNYWLNLAEFKMFISELWGRIDLGERVIRIYRESGHIIK